MDSRKYQQPSTPPPPYYSVVNDNRQEHRSDQHSNRNYPESREAPDFNEFVRRYESSMSAPVGEVTNPYEKQRTRWDELKQTVSIVVDLASVLDPDGADVYFLNREPMLHVHNSSELENIFAMEPEDDDQCMGYLNDWDKKIPNLDVVDDYRSEKKEIQACRGRDLPFSFGDFCFVLGLTTAWSRHGGGRGRGGYGSFQRICQLAQSNVTQAQILYIQGQLLLTALQANSSYTTLLNSYTRTVAYIKNSANQQLFFNNCALFVNGLQQSMMQDKTLSKQLKSNIRQQFTQLLITVFGNSQWYW
ncbi:unnamed protein product [Didymodactylos carnosus]|uniref:Uncharacterized protein n=1 Tax=Didymodactylos carnosus TaxID=1234261 RepID=A0A814KPA3_9BILA|nr:unnamed protein product [Didymodactylos carnosus]CAF1055105.1 unnamed protein product [Didymodactylos carnosus]CAF3740273.1 unnamed protein product [Didymodactylos carnosus]CAF3824241.1 unnamed protein product [Didymodactylos carnosus]